jgi:hypothetical protein
LAAAKSNARKADIPHIKSFSRKILLRHRQTSFCHIPNYLPYFILFFMPNIQLSVFIRNEGTSHMDGKLRPEAKPIIAAIAIAHKLVSTPEEADLIIDHLALGAPKDLEGRLDWGVAEIILESEGIINPLPLSRVKHNEQ